MDQPPTRPPKKPGRPALKTPHVRICGYVPFDFAREVASEAAFRGISMGDLIVEAFSARTKKTWKDGT